MNQSDLLQQLKDFSTKKKMSHQRLAKSLGISFVTLNQWLNGHRKLRINECQLVEKLIKK